MELELGIARACRPDGCHVQALDGASMMCAYAPPVYNRIKVRPGDLVAVDRPAPVPAVVWRWRRAQVIAVEGEAALLTRRVTRRTSDDPVMATFSVPLTGMVRGVLQEGDFVFYGDDQVLAQAAGDLPATDAPFRGAFARIRAAYAA